MIKLTEYIYLASEQPLSTGSITLNGLSKPTGNLLNKAFFFFINDFEGDPPGKFSYSNYLKTLNYQVCSMCSLPSDNQNIETPSAITLLGYIRNHFKNTCTTKLYILSALNGFENKPISKTVTRKLSDLSYKDLYYQEMKLLKIIR